MNNDLHTQRAAEIFKVPAAQVTPAMRRYAKMVGYAMAYTVQTNIHPALLARLAIAKAKARK